MRQAFGFVLCHGWSYTAHTLEPLADELRTLTPHILFDDLGYWSDEPFRAPRDKRLAWIAVGHSYGFVHCMRDTMTPWSAYIGIGAFLSFPAEGLAEMRAAAATEPLRTVRAFRRRCGLLTAETIPPHHAAGHARLLATLDDLATLQLAAPQAPTLYLHGENDRIVKPLPQSIIAADAGHNLGIDHTTWCREQIQGFVAALS